MLIYIVTNPDDKARMVLCSSEEIVEEVREACTEIEVRAWDTDKNEILIFHLAYPGAED